MRRLIIVGISFVLTTICCLPYTLALETAIPNQNPLWKKLPVQQMKVTLFNYKNWEQVKSGEASKLVVEESGPYLYSKIIERINVTVEGDELNYIERSRYKYIPSGQSENDEVVVPNLPLLHTIRKIKDMSFFVKTALNQLITTVNEQAFIKLKAKEFFWGYKDHLTEIINNVLKPDDMTNAPISLLGNDTLSDPITMNTGEKDVTKKNLIVKVNGQTSLNKWDNTECDQVEGSDGFIFPPSVLYKKQTIYAFYPGACRRLPHVFDQEIQKNDGSKLYRYRWPRDVFDSQCGCDVKGTCPPKGVFNMTACYSQVPIDSISLPHFHLGDEKLRSDILGLKPDATLHETYIDIDPVTGVAVNGRNRFQLNIQVAKSGIITPIINYLPDGLILPVAWIDVGWDDFCNCDPK